MAIHGATPTMLKAIDSLQLANVNPGSKQTLALHLGEGKDYTIQIGKGGDVSVARDLNHLSAVGRIKSAVVDFFSRATTRGESALTTRATQIQSEVQRQLSELSQVKEMVHKAFYQPIGEFKNEAQYLKQGSDPSAATLSDITESNQKRLGLETLDKASLSFVKEHFPSFINGKEAIFSMLSSRVIEKTLALHTSLAGDPKALGEALNILGHESEAFSAKVNAEFNRSYVQLFEQRAAAELQTLTEANTRANGLQVEEGPVSTAAEPVSGKGAKRVHFNEDPVSETRVFERDERRVHFAENPASETRVFDRDAAIKV